LGRTGTSPGRNAIGSKAAQTYSTAGVLKFRLGEKAAVSPREELKQHEMRCEQRATVEATGFAAGTPLPDNPGVVIPRLERSTVHEEFVRENRHISVVMISVEAARRFVEQGETAASAFPNVLVAVTTTIHDDQLEWWYPDREVGLVRDFQPDIYLPCDRPVYAGDRPAERRDTIRRYLNDLADVTDRLSDMPVAILPLVKGITESERRQCYQTFRDLGLDRWAYYCAQYFLYGNRGEALVQDVHSVVQEGSPRGLVLVGLQSGSYLSRMPAEVFAAAGKRWIDQSNLRNDALDMQQIQRHYGTWKRHIENILDGGQTRLSDYVSSGVIAYGD